MGRPAKKKAYWEAKKAEAGRLQARREFYKKTPIAEILKEKLLVMVDKIDPIETAAILGTTALVYGTIKANEGLIQKATLWYQVIQGVGSPFISAAISVFNPPKEIKVEDWQILLASFAVAYIIVKHGGQLVGLLDKGMTQIVGMLLA